MHAGHKRVPPEVAAELAMHTVEDQLTTREPEILKLIANDRTHAVTIGIKRGIIEL